MNTVKIFQDEKVAALVFNSPAALVIFHEQLTELLDKYADKRALFFATAENVLVSDFAPLVKRVEQEAGPLTKPVGYLTGEWE